MNDVVKDNESFYGKKAMSFVLGLEKVQQSDQVYPCSSFEHINRNLTVARTHMFDALIEIRTLYELKGITCFKPRSIVTSLGVEESLKGAVLDDEIHPNEDQSRDAQKNYEDSPYIMETKNEKWKDSLDQERNGLITLSIEDNEIFDIIKKENQNQLNSKEILKEDKKSLYIYALKEFPDMQVGILCVFKEVSIRENEEFKSLLSYLAVSFLARWQGLYSYKVKLQLELLLRYTNHEIAQVTSGIESLMHKAKKQLSHAEIEYTNKNLEIDKNYPFVNNFIKQSHNLVDGFTRYSYLVDMIASNQSNGNIIGEPNFESFFPYHTFMFRWHDIYGDRLKSQSKILKIEEVKFTDASRPEMYADPRMVEQVVYNLLQNAEKYCYLGTTIYLDYFLSEDEKEYIISVKSFGQLIKEEDKEKIYEYGYRANDSMNRSGIGFGLYIAKQLAEVQGGTLTHESAYLEDKYNISCEYNIPMLYNYKLLEGRYSTTREELNKYEKALIDIKRDNLDKKVLGLDISLGIITPLYVYSHIKEKVAENTFILKIPTDRGKKGKKNESALYRR